MQRAVEVLCDFGGSMAQPSSLLQWVTKKQLSAGDHWTSRGSKMLLGCAIHIIPLLLQLCPSMRQLVSATWHPSSEFSVRWLIDHIPINYRSSAAQVLTSIMDIKHKNAIEDDFDDCLLEGEGLSIEVQLTDWWLVGLHQDPDLLFNLLLRSYAMHEVQLL